MILLKNQYYLNVLLKTTESIVDSVSEYNLERNNNSQIFMNELCKGEVKHYETV